MTEHQLQIMLSCELDPRPGLYHLGSAYRIRGDLDVRRFERAVNAVRARHPALRTVLCDEHEDIQLRVLLPNAGAQSVVAVHDGTGLNSCGADELAGHEVISRLTENSLHLYGDSLFRIHLLMISPLEYLLVSVVHHLIFDAWSGGIFRRDLSDAYNQPEGFSSRTTAEPEMPERSTAGIGSSRRSEGIDYWRHYLTDAPVGFGLVRYPGRSEPEMVTRSISSVLRHSVAQLAARLRVTPFVIYLAAFSAITSEMGESADVLLGIPVSQRRDKAALETVGLYINTVPFSCSVDRAMPFADFVNLVQSRAEGLYRYGDIPLSEIVATVWRRRDRIGRAPYQISFNFLQAPQHQLRMDGMEIRRLRVGPVAIDTQMSVTIEAVGSEYVIQLVHMLGPDHSPIGGEVIDSYIDALARAVSAPHLRLHDILSVSRGSRGPLETSE